MIPAPCHRALRLGACLVLLLVVASLGACGDHGGRVSRHTQSTGGLAEHGSLAGANVLLITLDTTRRDHLACYGYESIATPTLDRLARDGVLFSRATAVAPITLPAHTSILTGLYPRHHGVRSNGFYTLDGKHVTLAETLHDAGYATGAILAAFPLSAQFGLDQGFDFYDDAFEGGDEDPLLFAERRATQVTDHALAWLGDRTDQPFFLWVHYFDPHSPYRAPDPYRLQHRDEPYDAEIAYMDAELGRLLDGLARLGHDDDTIIVAVGDHGEALGEHGEPTHAFLLYEGTMHVPLIMRCGQRLGGGIERTDRVSQVDVVPTLLGLLGLDPPADLDGVDLQEVGPQPRPIFGETYQGKMEHGWAALYSVYENDLKYIDGPTPELHDLADDSHEDKDLVADRPEVASRLRALLSEHFGEELGASGAPLPSRELSDEEITRLRSLGYAFTNPKGQPLQGRGADPRRMVKVLQEVDHVVFSKPPGQRGPEVVAELESILQKYPDFEPGYRYLGIVRRENRDLAGAAEAFSRAVKLNPESPELRLMLADTRARLGKTAQAIGDLRGMLAEFPRDAKGHQILGRLLLSSGRPDSAMTHLWVAAELDPELDGVAEDLERAAAAAGRSTELLPFLNTQLATHARSIPMRKAKATLLYRLGRQDEGDAVLREGYRLSPDDPQAVNDLARFLIARPDNEGRRVARAAELMATLPEDVVRSDAELILTRSQILGAQGRLDEAQTMARDALELATRNHRNAVARRVQQYLEQIDEARPRSGG